MIYDETSKLVFVEFLGGQWMDGASLGWDKWGTSGLEDKAEKQLTDHQYST
jgi:hypothetical protein